MKFEIHTTIITKIANTKEEALATACKMSRKHGRATIWCNHQRLATYKSGMKIS